MDEGRVPKKLMTCGVGGKRRKDRPRADVEEDLREMRIICWKTNAKNRKKWKNVTKQVMGVLNHWKQCFFKA
jgi:hypothetical protein